MEHWGIEEQKAGAGAGRGGKPGQRELWDWSWLGEGNPGRVGSGGDCGEPCDLRSMGSSREGGSGGSRTGKPGAQEDF